MKTILDELHAIRSELKQLRAEISQLRSEAKMPEAATPHPSKPSTAKDFFVLIAPYCAGYDKSDSRMLAAMLHHLHRFWPEKRLPLNQLTKARCRDFLEYLYLHLRGNTPAEYFKKFRKLLLYLQEEGHLTDDPTAGIRLTQCNELTKSILTDAEIELLAATPAAHPEVKRAFLFSCYTGLRRCDVIRLTGQQVDLPAHRLTVVQQKVRTHSSQSVLHIHLNATALRLLGAIPEDPTVPLFPLPAFTTVKKALRQWMEAAGIPKHITFHCARHTFITRLMIHGANIATTASLAGHSSTRHTEKYIHIVDDLKREAMDSLPALPDIV
jgi:integrase